MFELIAKRSATVRIEGNEDWLEIRVGKTAVLNVMAQFTDEDEITFWHNVNFATKIAKDRGETLEDFDPRSLDGKMWNGEDLRF